MTRLIGLSLICDLAEEGWPSMDLVAEMLFDSLQANYSAEFRTQRLRPDFRRRFSRLAAVGGAKMLWNADRLLNRHLDYPHWLRKAAAGCDLFHIVDHSYAQLAHSLPAGRTVVTCHDMDAFRCLFDPDKEPRPIWFRRAAQRVLDGVSAAAEVICVSRAVRAEVLEHNLAKPEQISVIYNGIHPSCSTDPDTTADAEVGQWLEPHSTYLLNVGSTIRRKRIDVLLDVFAAVHARRPDVKLLRVGGPFTTEQAKRAESLGVAGSICTLPFLDRNQLAAIYRRAALLLQPSEAEGFGLPVIEGLACGCPVLASDLPVFREIGGEAVEYCGVADTPRWAAAILRLLEQKQARPNEWEHRRMTGLAHARRFSWAENARQTVEVYRRVLNN